MSDNVPVNSNVWEKMLQTYDDVLDSQVLHTIANSISSALAAFGIPKRFHPDNKDVALCFTASAATLWAYWFWLGNSHHKKRRALENDLRKAQDSVHELEERLTQLEEEYEHQRKETDKDERPIRVFMDGAFDMMHYGHMNAFRQGKSLGTHLVVGIDSDVTITECKGKPVNNDEERTAMVRSCRWVDEIVEGVPYVMNEEYLKYIIEKYQIDYVVHGDDPCIVDGKDVYESAKKMGKYLTIPRTEGISTTDIVGRMLLMTKSHHESCLPTVSESDQNGSGGSDSEDGGNENHVSQKLMSRRRKRKELFSRKSNFLTTSRIIRLFSASFKAPKPDDVIVYLAGSWDMLHIGHVTLLEKARQFGTYVIVGVHNDAVVNAQRGQNLPILNLHERVLSVLGCKYVDDVLFDAPYVITNELLSSLNVKVVVKGTIDPILEEEGLSSQRVDPYKVPRELDILKVIESTQNLTVIEIVDRIQEQRDRYVVKYNKKKVQEDAYYENKYAPSYGTTESE